MIIVLTANLCFAPLLRFILTNFVEPQTGVSITFETASGNFFKGRVNLFNYTIQRKNHPESNFNLKGDTLNIHVSMSELVSGVIALKFLSIAETKGSVEWVGKPEKPEEKRNFRIDRLQINGLHIDFVDRTIEKPFQANLDIFVDIRTISSSLSQCYTAFFKDNTWAIVKINNIPFVRETKGGKAVCQMDTVPIALFTPYLVLLECFNTGSMNIQMADKTDENGQKMRLSITLNKDCTVKMPEKMFEPAVRFAFQQLDKSTNASQRDIQVKLEKLRVQIETADQYMATVFRLPGLEDVRKKYNELKTKYAELKIKLELLKATVLMDALNRFLQSGIPIEFDLLIANDEVHLDMDSAFTGVLEKTYVEGLKNYGANINVLLDIVPQFFGDGKKIEQPLNKIKDLLRF
jgi:hypothetical protein